MKDLCSRLTVATPFLRWSFSALCLNFAAPESLPGHGPDVVQSYTRLAHDGVMRLASEGTATLEVLQALCLLALNDMIGKSAELTTGAMKATKCLIVGNAARAFMTIGIASRLQAFRNSDQNVQSFCEIQNDEEAASRCYWSISILEQAFSPRLKHGAFERRQSSANTYPPSAPCPPAIGANANDLSYQAYMPAPASSVISDRNGLRDLGVNAYGIRLISLWGDVTTYLLEIQSGNSENPWLPTSMNMKLNSQMHEFETQVASSHLFRRVLPLKRSAAELLEHQEYWVSWALMQIACHTIPATLNHPFIHLVAKSPHEGTQAARPSFFLQQTVDLALFHAGWVAQLLLICERFPFEINNPVIGHMITATATVCWIFQFSRDTAVSAKAKEDLGKCERFLGKMAAKWPHIAQKVCSRLFWTWI